MPLTITVTDTRPTQAKVDMLVVPLFSDLRLTQAIAPSLATTLHREMRQVGFKAEWGTSLIFPLRKGKASFIALLGLGDKAATPAQHAEAMRRGLGYVVQDSRKHTLHNLALALPALPDPAALAVAAVDGAELANYRFTEYTTRLQQEQAGRAVRRLIILVPRSEFLAVRQATAAAQKILAGTTLARDLVNQPASALAPRDLVTIARKIAAASPRITLQVLNRTQAAKQGFSAFLAVARGSTEEPYVIHLTYRPPKESRNKIFIVGKGVTFDSGGLSLKPAEMMELMKTDMAGAATVLGLFSVLDTVAPAAEVHGVIASCENMPSGTAYRPGDILRAKNGKTIEVLNTDAEGRITLADALSYAAEQKPTAIIDLATLTGACLVALGETVAGLWSNDAALQQSLLNAAGVAGEGLCALPLPEEYKPFIQSQVADLRNLSISRYGGAITAAMFLREFVAATPWAHLDIAGPSYVERVCLPYYPIGATAYGLRTLVEYLKEQRD